MLKVCLLELEKKEKHVVNAATQILFLFSLVLIYLFEISVIDVAVLGKKFKLTSLSVILFIWKGLFVK